MYEFVKTLVHLVYVDEVWLYGSRARRDNSSCSDIDSAIVCPTATDEEWRLILDVLAKVDLLLKIDCVRFD